MRRIFRHLLNALTLLSLLLFLAVVVVWECSSITEEKLSLQDESGKTFVASERGCIQIVRYIPTDPILRKSDRSEWTTTPWIFERGNPRDAAIDSLLMQWAEHHWNLLGLQWYSGKDALGTGRRMRWWYCAVPD